MKLIILIAILLHSLVVFSEDIMSIGIYRNLNVKNAIFSCENSEYNIIADDTVYVASVEKEDKITIYEDSNKVKLIKNNEKLGIYNKVTFLQTKENSVFKIKTITPSTKLRTYYGELEIKTINNVFTLINNVPLEKYLIGVLESEVGNYQSKEFYKVQAIISRTYALKYKNKFLNEGFMLTDLVNCQVYFGKYYQNPKIYQAVEETKGLVLVNEDMEYITAAFFSNSGGQTENSENVWNKQVSYLRSKKDPFSIGKNNYKWTKSIKKDRWLSYLKNKYNYPIEDSVSLYKVLNFLQTNRKKYLAGWDSHILLTDIRKDWRLKSTYFSIYNDSEHVVLKGYGFGHGVGLSQEGAMNMIDLGYSYYDVLSFYYTDVILINKNKRLYYLLD